VIGNIFKLGLWYYK